MEFILAALQWHLTSMNSDILLFTFAWERFEFRANTIKAKCILPSPINSNRALDFPLFFFEDGSEIWAGFSNFDGFVIEVLWDRIEISPNVITE